MRSIYINDLKEKLEAKSVNNPEALINKIEKRYDLGLEAGLTEEEIEEMIGDIDELINQYAETSKDEKIDNSKEDDKLISIEISSISDDVTVEFEDITDIEYEMVNINVDCYDIAYENKELKIKYKKAKFLALNRKASGHIIVRLPKNIKFGKFQINTTSGDIVIKEELECETFKINSVSGDIELDNITSDYIKLSTVSGDITALSITGNEIYVDTVSGDMGSNIVNCDKLSLSSVSGDINIANAKANIKASSVSGDINVNGINVGVSVKKTFKGLFR